MSWWHDVAVTIDAWKQSVVAARVERHQKRTLKHGEIMVGLQSIYQGEATTDVGKSGRKKVNRWKSMNANKAFLQNLVSEGM